MRNIMKKLISSSLAITLSFTSLSGIATSVVSAAPVAAEDQLAEAAADNTSVNKSILGGLLAVGLISVLTKSGSKLGADSNASKNSVTAPQASSPQQATTTTPRVSVPQQVSIPLQVSPSQQVSTPQPVSNPQSVSSPLQSGLTADEKRAFDLMNADRIANDLPALKLNLDIVKVARTHGQDMINRNYFAHENPEGQSPFDRMRAAGISFGYAGENLAINRSVDAAEKAFMNSPGHRANILNSKYTEVGIGVRYDASGSVYVVQNFISR